VPMVIYALLGTSRPLSVSTTTTIAILTASALALAAPGGGSAELAVAAATLSVMVGLVLVLATVLRLGFVANFISEPVLTGFKSGIGLVIVVDQVPKLLGIHIDKTGFFRDVLAIVQHLPQSSLVTVLLSLCILAFIFGLERFLPKAPAPLLAVAAAIVVSALLGLQAAGVAMVGEVPRGLPSLVTDDEGRVKCVACQMCEWVCPPEAIRIVPQELPGDNAIEKGPKEFDESSDAFDTVDSIAALVQRITAARG